MFLHIGILLYNIKDKNRLVSIAVMGILSIEVYSVLTQALDMYNSGGINPGQLKGVTANRIITAFSIAIKIPYVIYLIYRGQKIWLKITYAFLILSLFSLTLIQSRASFVAAALIGIPLFLWTSISYYKTKEIKFFLRNIYYVAPYC